MARLTWQNINAPNLSGATSAMLTAGNLFGAGAGSISEAFGGIQDGRIRAASQEALADAARFTSAADWDKAMAASGLAGITNVDPRMIDAESMKALMGMRSSLLDNAFTMAQTDFSRAQIDQSRATTANTMADTAYRKIQSEGAQQDMVLDKNRDAREAAVAGRQAAEFNYNFDRTKAGNAASDAQAEAAARGVAFAEQLIADTRFTDPKDGMRAIQESGLPPQERMAALDHFQKQVDSGIYEVSWRAEEDVKNNPYVMSVRSDLEAHKLLSDANYAGDGQVQFWRSAKGSFSSGEAALPELLTYFKGLNGDAPNPEAVAESAGSISRAFSDIKKEYPGMPEQLIAQAIKNNLESGWRLRGEGDALQIDYDAVRQQLDYVKDPVQRNAAETRAQEIAEIDQERAKYVTRLDKLVQELSVLESRNAPAEQKGRVIKQIEALQADVQAFTAKYPEVPAGGKAPTESEAPKLSGFITGGGKFGSAVTAPAALPSQPAQAGNLRPPSELTPAQIADLAKMAEEMRLQDAAASWDRVNALLAPRPSVPAGSSYPR